jgi:membrane protein implicated in regulation of membrane protease activity
MPENGQRSIAEVFQDAVGHIQEIVRAEIRLAKVETKEEVVKAKGAAVMLGGGAIMGYFAGALLIVSGTCALALVMPWWAAALVMAALCGIIAGGLLGAGRAMLAQMHGPDKTVNSLTEDLRWARNQTR